MHHWQAAIEAGACGVQLSREDLAQMADRHRYRDRTTMRIAGLRLGLGQGLSLSLSLSTFGYAGVLRAETLGSSARTLPVVMPTIWKAMA